MADEPAEPRRRRGRRRRRAEAHRRGRRSPRAGEQPAAPERTAVLVGYGPLVEGSSRPRRRSRSADWAAAHAVADDVGLALAGGRIGPKVLPPVRKLAHDLGVDLNKMVGSGKDGMITRDDVLRVVSGADVSPSARRPDAPSAAHRPGLARPPSRPADEPPTSRPEAASSAPRETRTPDRRCPQADRRRDGGQRVHGSARVDVADRRRHADAGAARAVPGGPRARRPPHLDPHARRQGGDDRGRPQPVAQRALGRGRGGDRPVRVREPRHRRGDPARAAGAEHQGRRPAPAARPRRRDRAPDRGRPGGHDDARGPGRRDDHDHQHRGASASTRARRSWCPGRRRSWRWARSGVSRGSSRTRSRCAA